MEIVQSTNVLEHGSLMYEQLNNMYLWRKRWCGVCVYRCCVKCDVLHKNRKGNEPCSEHSHHKQLWDLDRTVQNREYSVFPYSWLSTIYITTLITANFFWLCKFIHVWWRHESGDALFLMAAIRSWGFWLNIFKINLVLGKHHNSILLFILMTGRYKHIW